MYSFMVRFFCMPYQESLSNQGYIACRGFIVLAIMFRSIITFRSITIKFFCMVSGRGQVAYPVGPDP